jgi:hypothetical protein
MQKKYIETRLSNDDDISALNKTYKIEIIKPLRKIKINSCNEATSIY